MHGEREVWRALVAPLSLYQTFCLSSPIVDGSGSLPLRQQLLAAALPRRARMCAELLALLTKQEEDAKHIVDVPEPQIKEELLEVAAKDTLQERISERLHQHTVDQPGDQSCRDPAESIHRQGCRDACGYATTGPSDSEVVKAP